MRCPSHGPLGWAALALVVVTYAHVILLIAIALLAIPVAARVLLSPAPGQITMGLARRVERHRAKRQLAAQRAPLHGRTAGDRGGAPEEVGL